MRKWLQPGNSSLTFSRLTCSNLSRGWLQLKSRSRTHSRLLCCAGLQRKRPQLVKSLPCTRACRARAWVAGGSHAAVQPLQEHWRLAPNSSLPLGNT